MRLKRRFEGLRVIAFLFNTAAVGVLLVTAASAVGLGFGIGSPMARELGAEAAYGAAGGALLIFAVGSACSVLLLALGETLQLGVSVEENTRATVALLERQEAQIPESESRAERPERLPADRRQSGQADPTSTT